MSDKHFDYMKKKNWKRFVLRQQGHLEFINTMLDNQCPSDNLEDGWLLFNFELHCTPTVVVEARKKNGWEIRKVKFEEWN